MIDLSIQSDRKFLQRWFAFREFRIHVLIKPKYFEDSLTKFLMVWIRLEASMHDTDWAALRRKRAFPTASLHKSDYSGAVHSSSLRLTSYAGYVRRISDRCSDWLGENLCSPRNSFVTNRCKLWLLTVGR